jgi:hypothetical protein
MESTQKFYYDRLFYIGTKNIVVYYSQTSFLEDIINEFAYKKFVLVIMFM